MGLRLSVPADELGCSERTLRRYIKMGLLHGRRVARDQLELSDSEHAYLRAHWELLSTLMGTLRTEPEIRLAVLFGSAATGQDTADSDVDVLVVHRRPEWSALAGLNRRLRRAVGRPVDIISLGQAQAQSSLLADVLREGRVLVDRDGLWSDVQQSREEILAAGAREDALVLAAARETIAAVRERLAIV